MKAILLVSTLLLLAVSGLLSRQPSPPESAQKEIQDLEVKINASYAANDLTAYFAAYAPDFTQWLPEGRTDLAAYKQEWTRYIAAGNRIQSAEFSDLHIQVGPSQDAAVASYLLHVKTKLADGRITEEDNQETDVFFKREGVWKIVELHYSLLPKKAQ
ncbi:MAG TPA: nuclear transport factor 2 family protein [Candidatus Saccharimonadales bacterium]|nr:nuclear transport factor 2 family protein [Candidatus Saccharimonadales bacterium]